MLENLKKWWENLYRQRWMMGASAASLVLLVVTNLENISVVALKLVLVTLFSTAAYYIDRAMSRHSRPHELIERMQQSQTPSEWAAWAQVAAASEQRRGFIVGAIALAGALGL